MMVSLAQMAIYWQRWRAALVVAGTFVSLAVSATSQAAPLQVVYANEAYRYSDNSYEVQLLRLALDHYGQPYHLAPYEAPDINEARTRVNLSHGVGPVTIAWFGTSKGFERQLLPVRVPIYRGLLGYRLFIIRADRQADFDKVQNLRDLQKLTALQGTHWPDVTILEQAGLYVETAQYENLMGMISTGRGDFFPRGAHEPFRELAATNGKYPELTVENGLVLVYRFPLFYFVAPQNRELHKAVNDGLEAAIDDGSFLRLFESHPDTAKVLEQAHLEKRRAIYLPNPLLSPETAALPDRYWMKLPGDEILAQ